MKPPMVWRFMKYCRPADDPLRVSLYPAPAGIARYGQWRQPLAQQ